MTVKVRGASSGGKSALITLLGTRGSKELLGGGEFPKSLPFPDGTAGMTQAEKGSSNSKVGLVRKINSGTWALFIRRRKAKDRGFEGFCLEDGDRRMQCQETSLQ